MINWIIRKLREFWLRHRGYKAAPMYNKNGHCPVCCKCLLYAVPTFEPVRTAEGLLWQCPKCKSMLLEDEDTNLHHAVT